MIRDALINSKSKYLGHYFLLNMVILDGYLFFQNLMTLMFQIWEIRDEEPRSIRVT